MLLMAFPACTQDYQSVPSAPESITLDTSYFEVEAAGETLTLKITAPTRPQLTDIPSWITYHDHIYQDYKMTVQLEVAPNDKAAAREAVITVLAAGVDPVTIGIRQEALEWASNPSVPPANLADWEKASVAVKNMGAGWNLGNTLDSNSGDVNHMWIEGYTDRTPADYETAWGQAVTTRELIRMFKQAGFNAIRIPVTWYPHIGTLQLKWEDEDWHWDQADWTGYEVDPAWMARVKEVVDYVINEDMYCLLNVHHDTGAASTAWLVASEEGFEAAKPRYQALWRQISETFRDYGEKLLFESYNEMLDPYDSWCFASFATPERYDADVAESAYTAINNYAKLFVETVRSTGGNNVCRNLVVNTYGACSGDGTWNPHLLEPLTSFRLPEEPGHIAVQIHSYWEAEKFASQKADIDRLFANIDQYLVQRLGVPVIIGEWGGGTHEDSDANVRFAGYFSEKARDAGVAALWWMGLSDGKTDRATPAWTTPRTKNAILKPYLDNQ